ncbi:MAG: isocitrate lyase/phosphoenolpyruvate mutase family protein [Deltaproteobacteria bacterium]|nr:isocitrate lyase/phosphoenolpyruvate mutase family protein [Deltaproteobacteria bacterium]
MDKVVVATANAKSRRLRELVRAPEILVMPGAYDVLSARLFEQLGFKAIQCSSGGIAMALGYPDGEVIGREHFVEVTGKIASAVSVPVNAEALAFPDRSFDAVASSLSLCTFPDPVAALREMARVCRPQGRILLLKHGRSDRKWLAGWQDRRAERHAKPLGCHWNREPQELVAQAGLKLTAARRTFFGIFHILEVMPT